MGGRVLQKGVFSDLDGTLAGGFITVDFVRYLASEKLVDEQAFRRHERLLEEYAEGRIKYLDLVPQWAQSVAECFKGKKVKELEAAGRDFFPTWVKGRLFPTTKPLFELLRSHGYLTFLISAGWDYLVGLAAKEIGADDYRAIVFGEKDGLFDGTVGNDMPVKKGKISAINELKGLYGIDFKKTIGFGDSPHDEAIFSNVKKQVALNPSSELEKEAKKNGWFVATHKNVLEVMQECFEKGAPAKKN